MEHVASGQAGLYPPAPWRSTGQLWLGLYDSATQPALPKALQSVARPNWLILILVRYLEGTLRYDELVVGALVRRGPRVGLHVHSIWVNDEASLWGGRRIWGLPKQLATFAWNGDSVRVTDEHGVIATVTVNVKPSGAPWLWTPAPGFGIRDNRCLYTVARIQARVSRSKMSVTEFSHRLPYRIAGAPIVGLAANPIRITVPPPKVLP
jgi:hypothetical protein